VGFGAGRCPQDRHREIGHGAIVLSGSHIGRGSIVGAGAVVVGDVPAYSIVVPRKARMLRKRFNDDEIDRHENALRDMPFTTDHGRRARGPGARQAHEP